ncbi:hypothetical protein NDA13_001741 [Ustilago tritici]|nr:hypothetical protein NDA13_001741 [Ustilago tritici]
MSRGCHQCWCCKLLSCPGGLSGSASQIVSYSSFFLHGLGSILRGRPKLLQKHSGSITKGNVGSVQAVTPILVLCNFPIFQFSNFPCVGVGALYALAATRIKNGGDYGYEIATGASALLLSSSAPRFRKGPVPMGLTITSAFALAYYGKKVYDFRQ